MQKQTEEIVVKVEPINTILNNLVRRLLQTIRVISESKIEIQFQSGIVIRQEVLCDD